MNAYPLSGLGISIIVRIYYLNMKQVWIILCLVSRHFRFILLTKISVGTTWFKHLNLRLGRIEL